MNKIAVLLAIAALTSCSSVNLQVRNDVKIDTLGIYLETSPATVPEIRTGFESELDRFIISYNASRGHKFKLKRTADPQQSALRMRLIGTRFVTPSEQTAGVLVSLIGLSLPFIMASSGADFILFFYYFPKVRSQIDLSISPDINKPGQRNVPFLYASPGFLKTPENQLRKHVLNFDRFLALAVRRVEASAKK